MKETVLGGVSQDIVWKYVAAATVFVGLVLAVHGVSIGRPDASVFVLAQAAIMSGAVLLIAKVMP